MRILGIDPALSITGYGVIDFALSRISVVEAGVIKTSPKQQMPQRLKKIFGAVEKLIKDTKPDVMVVEKLYSHYRHPTTAYILGEARGIVCLAAARRKLALVEYSATRIKKAIVGAGLAPKYQVQKMVSGMLGLKEIPLYADVTDALALAIAHGQMSRARI